MILGFLVWAVCGTIIGLLGGEGAGWRDKPYHSDWPGALPKIPDEDGNRTACTDFLKALPTSAFIGLPHNGDERWIPRPHLPFIPSVSIKRQAETLEAERDQSGPPYSFYKSKSFFHFEVTSEDGFYIVGRGRYSIGPVQFVLEEPQGDSHLSQSGKPVIEVEVAARWNDKELLKTSKVCSLVRNGTDSSGKGRDYGLGIYTPQPEYPEQYRYLSFEIIVRFPPSSLASLRFLGLAGPSFSPVDLALSPINFDVVDIRTENGALVVTPPYSLSSRYATLQTSNSRIEGIYNTTDTLRLQSTNGPIRAKVNLIKVLKSEMLEMRAVLAETTNGGVQLQYGQHPYNVVLNSTTRTTNGDADVRHGSAFEGDFHVRYTAFSCSILEFPIDIEGGLLQIGTSWGKGVVSAPSSARDPSGRGRKRSLDITQDEHSIGIVEKTGKVYWAPEHENRMGKSIVETSLGRAGLEFL